MHCTSMSLRICGEGTLAAFSTMTMSAESAAKEEEKKDEPEEESDEVSMVQHCLLYVQYNGC